MNQRSRVRHAHSEPETSIYVGYPEYVQRFATREAADAADGKDDKDEDEEMSDIGSISDNDG